VSSPHERERSAPTRTPLRNNGGMEIRTASESDLELVLRLRLDFLSELRAPVQFPEGFPAVTRTFLERTQRDGHLYSWIAQEGREALGIVSVIVNDAPPLPEDVRCREGYIINEYVVPAARKKGIGRTLLRTALASAEALGIRRFRLIATEAGRPLYASEGFTAADRTMELPVPAGGT